MQSVNQDPPLKRLSPNAHSFSQVHSNLHIFGRDALYLTSLIHQPLLVHPPSTLHLHIQRSSKLRAWTEHTTALSMEAKHGLPTSVYLLCHLLNPLLFLPKSLLSWLFALFPLFSSSTSPTPPPPPSPDPAMDLATSSELRRVFDLFDKNGDGKISKRELTDLLVSLGILISEKELEVMMEKMDVNGDGCLDVGEFGELYREVMEERPAEEEAEMREAFGVFDADGDGYITVEELRSVLASLGLKQGQTVEECRRMIGKVDADGNGVVDFQEFKKMMGGGAELAALTQ